MSIQASSAGPCPSYTRLLLKQPRVRQSFTNRGCDTCGELQYGRQRRRRAASASTVVVEPSQPCHMTGVYWSSLLVADG
jgi:hypothetical protein